MEKTTNIIKKLFSKNPYREVYFKDVYIDVICSDCKYKYLSKKAEMCPNCDSNWIPHINENDIFDPINRHDFVLDESFKIDTHNFNRWNISEIYKIQMNIYDRTLYGCLHYGESLDPNAWVNPRDSQYLNFVFCSTVDERDATLKKMIEVDSLHTFFDDLILCI